MIISGTVHLKVDDLSSSVYFYNYLLGLPVQERNANFFAVFNAQGVTLKLEQQFYRGEDVPPKNTVSLGIAVLKLDPILEHIRKANVNITGVHDTGDGKILTLNDPDGNKIFVREIGELKQEK